MASIGGGDFKCRRGPSFTLDRLFNMLLRLAVVSTVLLCSAECLFGDESKLEGLSRHIVKQTANWLEVIRRDVGIFLPFGNTLLLSVMRNQHKIALLYSFVIFSLAVKVALPKRGHTHAAKTLSFILTASALFLYVEIDPESRSFKHFSCK